MKKFYQKKAKKINKIFRKKKKNLEKNQNLKFKK